MSVAPVHLLVAVAVAGLVATGCQTPQGSDLSPRERERFRQLQAVNPVALEAAVREFLDSFATRLYAAAGNASADGAGREVREAALQLRIRTMETVQALREQTDARSLFVYTWLAVVGMRQQLTDGELSRRFADRAAGLLETVHGLEEDLLRIGRAYFPPGLIDESVDDIERAALVRGQRLGRVPVVAVTEESDLMAVLRIPLLPVSTLQGVSTTPEAIDRFGQSVRVVGQTIKEMPQRIRWEAELLQWDLAEDGPVAQLLKELHDANRSLEQAVEVARNTPDRVADRLDSSLQKLREDLPAWTEFTSNLRAATEQARLTAVELRPLIEGCTAAIAEIRLLVEEIRQLQSVGQSQDAVRQGTDYNELADRTRLAAAELRGLLQDLRDENANRRAVMAFESAGQRLMRSAFLYAAILLGLAAAAAIALKRLAVTRRV
ncbi:MAG: hypothetical protein NZ561_10930 [Phycisphaerae bacterium]|nr:hypothetical protein [Phycisphaerae bacterium]MDW8261363.1 hypothetical protein [Phycisphaerales bacterium]